ncbi:cell division protein ZipA C-terminal FtsZ-binding domain-containing protein [Thiomicrorhabdus sp.]|uniref:cell division protein ZipA C-terminal FtsZ-binding domain-containing protein n=1 Tax=Thiomicrorhabdus sp. TaxID=2039724 RepID=UPI0029C91EE7|nr:cell division protein ZipA C-terminal FtsZ-binding domain-containing protein [Thiomicrorhabdus sp.]
MNELQQVLVVFAVIVILVLYLLSRRKNHSSQKPHEQSSSVETPVDSKKEASEALNNLGEPHEPVSQKTEQRLHLMGEELPEIDPNQQALTFGEDFDLPESETLQPEITLREEAPQKARLEPVELNNELPPEPKPAQQSELFVLLVLGSQDFSMQQLHHALQSVDLSYSHSKAIYCREDGKGNEIIKVANMLEPGTFPPDPLEQHSSPGVALILELPTCIDSVQAMKDFILIARKISQRLNGRIYDMQRHLVKESDLMAMQQKAEQFEQGE